MEWQNILWSALGLIVTTFVSWALAKFSAWIDTKCKDAKNATNAKNAASIVADAVKATFQTYVDTLKKTGGFTAEAQRNALDMAKNTALAAMSDGLKKYIKDTYGDVNAWLETQIEANICDMKNTTNGGANAGG